MITKQIFSFIFLISLPLLVAPSIADAQTGNTNANKLDSLPYESIRIGVNNLCVNGDILGVVTGKGKNIRVFQEYSKYRISTENANSKIGIRLRLNIDLLDVESKLNLASLIGLGIAASTGKVKGKLNLDVLGVSGSAITNALPMPAELSEASIVSSLQAMSNIKSRLYDQNVVIVEQVLPDDLSGTTCSCQGSSCPLPSPCQGDSCPLPSP